MDVKFIAKAECLIENIDHKADSNMSIAKELERLFENEGIKASVDVCELTYIKSESE